MLDIAENLNKTERWLFLLSQDDPTPFFEPLLRSFLLGLTCGACFESLHVAAKVGRSSSPSSFKGQWWSPVVSMLLHHCA